MIMRFMYRIWEVDGEKRRDERVEESDADRGKRREWEGEKIRKREEVNKKKTANIVQAFLIRCNVSVLSNANLIRWKCQKRWRQIRRIVLKSKWHTFNWKIEFGAVVKWNNDKKKIIKNYWKHDRYVILYGN